MKFLVTGATGFLGSAVTRRLTAAGHSVRALVRDVNRPRPNASERVEVAFGDLTRPDTLNGACAGVDGVFHIAGLYAYWSREPEMLYRTNAGGTEALLKYARAAGVPRVVLTSTVATLKWPGKGKLADESAVASLDDLPGHYKKSKLMAEQAALALARPGFEVIVVNPTAPVGPGDARPTPTGRVVLEFLNHRFPGYVDTGMNICDVDDVADGHLLAFEKGRGGQRYILGSENLTLREIYQALKTVTGLRRRPVRVPYAIAYFAGLMDSLMEGKALRREPYIPLEGLRVSRHPLFVDCSKAINELGLPRRPAAESLLRAAVWYSANGYTRAAVSGARPVRKAKASR